MTEMSGSQPSIAPVFEDALSGHMACVSSCSDAFLAMDIGGTHARLALVVPDFSGGGPAILATRIYRCSDHPHLEDIVRCFCDELKVQPRECVLACAGYLHAGSVISKNLAWPVRLDWMKQTLGLDRIRFLNDLEALAYAVGQGAVDDAALLKMSMADNKAAGPVVVIGPGTGLGAAVWLPGQPSRVIATEAGHIQLAARAGIEQQVVAQIAQPDSHVPYEAVLSGPGLQRIYTSLCAIHDRYPALSEPCAITAAALGGGDEIAHQSLTLFCNWLGSFSADLSMLYGATGGVYLAGGFLSQMVDFMRQSPLVERFLDKGVMRPFLQRIPVRVMDHGQHGVIGAARWHLHLCAQEAGSAKPASL